jgi:mRNA turnover protein 4
LIIKKFVGEGGILFTNESVDDVISYFSKTQFDDHAKTGALVDKDIILPAGNVKYHNTDEDILISQEPMLKSLGMPIRLERGCLILDQEYIICKYGDRLTAEQAHILVGFYLLLSFHF